MPKKTTKKKTNPEYIKWEGKKCFNKNAFKINQNSRSNENVIEISLKTICIS